MILKKQSSFFVLLGKFRSRREASKADRFFFSTFFFLFVFVLDLFKISYLDISKRFFDDYLIPVKFLANDLMEIPNMISKYVDLKKENEVLRLQVDELRIKTSIVANAEKELAELKKLVNLKYDSNSFEFMEKVLGFDKSIYNSYLLISSTHAATKADSVVISANALVGLIVDSNDNIAKILPITSQKISVPTKTISGEHIILSGTGQKKMFSKEIKSNTISDLKIGETLYTSGAGGVYKKNIPVAKISKIDKIKNEISAKPIVELNKLSFVWVVDPTIKTKPKVE